MQRGTNQGRLGDFNQVVVLDAIRRSPGGMSRDQIARSTGLSRQATSAITRRLINLGLILEGSRIVSGRGQPRINLDLNASGRFAVGVHLDPAVMTFVILDLTGTIVESVQRPTPSVDEPAHAIEQIRDGIDAVIGRSRVDVNRILGVGIAAPGPIDINAGVVLDPPNLAGWGSVPLRDDVNRATGFPVLLDKDVTAAALAESWSSGTDGRRNLAFVYLGTGVGVGVVGAEGVVRGSSNNSGEIGNLLVPSLEGDGKFTRLSNTVQPNYLVRIAADRKILEAPNGADGLGGIGAAFTRLCTLSAEMDHEAIELLTSSANSLASAVESIANLLDVDRVVFGGPNWEKLSHIYLPVLQGRVANEFVARDVHVPSLAGTRIGENVGAVGAACLVLDNTFSTRPSVLLFEAVSHEQTGIEHVADHH